MIMKKSFQSILSSWRSHEIFIIFWCHYEMTKNHSHSISMSVYCKQLTVTTKHFWGKTIGKVSQSYELNLPQKSNFGIHADCLAKSQRAREYLSHQLAFMSKLPYHKCLPCLPSTWACLGVLYSIMLIMVLLTFRLN